MRIDARIPLRIAQPDTPPAPGEALLLEGADPPADRPAARFDAAPVRHAPACACCIPRGAVAAALNALFIARGRGGAWFSAVLAMPRDESGRAAIRQALADDPLASLRFRLVD